MTDEEAVTTAIAEIEALRKQVAELTSDENSKSYFAKYLVEKNKRRHLDDQLAGMTKERDQYKGLYLNVIEFLQDDEAREKELSACQKERDESVQAEMENHERIAAAQAREAKLREALEFYGACDDGCTCGDGWNHDVAWEALDLATTDNTDALDRRLQEERAKVAQLLLSTDLGGLKGQPEWQVFMADMLTKYADAIRRMK